MLKINTQLNSIKTPHLCFLCVIFRTTSFGDLQALEGGCHRIHARAGDAIVLPSKWIHCVLTHGDSIALAANFLSFGHSRLIVDAHFDIEEDTR